MQIRRLWKATQARSASDQKRYAMAFNANPRLHEAKYLNRLEISAMLLRSSVSVQGRHLDSSSALQSRG
jgi:hypothetical protein